MRKTLALALVLGLSFLMAGTAFAQNSLAVNNTAAMGPDNGGTACGGGNCGLEVMFPGGSTNPAKVVDNTPEGEAIYRASFWYDPTSLTPNPSSAGYFHVLIRATETSAFKASFMLLLTQKSNLNRLSIRAGTNGSVFRFSNRINLTGANLIQVEFTQSDTPGVAGGNVVLTVLEGPQAGMSVDIPPGLNNSTLHVDDLHMGAVGNISASISGSAYYDEFASFRTLAP